VGEKAERWIGIAKNLTKPLKYYGRAANQQDPKAAYKCGRLQEKAFGVGEDLREADLYYTAAALRGMAKASFRYGVVLENRGNAEAVQFSERAVADGHEGT
jgi:TPR repeat protein